jgi:hypothetical protein
MSPSTNLRMQPVTSDVQNMMQLCPWTILLLCRLPDECLMFTAASQNSPHLQYCKLLRKAHRKVLRQAGVALQAGPWPKLSLQCRLQKTPETPETTANSQQHHNSSCTMSAQECAECATHTRMVKKGL